MDLGVMGTASKTADCLCVPIPSLLFQGTGIVTAVWCGWREEQPEFWQDIFYEQGFLPAYRFLLTLIHEIPQLNPVEALIFPKEILYRRQIGFG